MCFNGLKKNQIHRMHVYEVSSAIAESDSKDEGQEAVN